MRRFLLLLAASAALVACRDKSIAEVTKHKGELTRDTAATQQKWVPADDGAKLVLGDGLKTGASSEAVVKLSKGGTLKLPPDTTIRFLASAPGAAAPKLSVETGEASIQAEGNEVAIETEIGVAHIEAGGTLLLAPSHVEVSIGAARIDTPDGGVALAPGKGFDIAMGGAILERAAPEDAGAIAVVDAGPPPIAVSGIQIAVSGRGVKLQHKGAAAITMDEASLAASPASPGDVVDVPAGAAIDVRRSGEHARFVGPAKVTIGDEGKAIARTASGKVELEGSATETSVDVPGGSVAAKAGNTRVDLDVSAATTKATVRAGEAELRGTTTETLRAGETATMNGKGVVALAAKQPALADLSMKAGDSIVVRDPRPPTAVGIDFSAVCPGAGIVKRGDVAFRGEKKANVPVNAGTYNYSVHCVGADGVDEREAAKGSVTVVADAARADLPRLPPSTVVDADGRKYTVLYQNLLPSIVARWADAPAGKVMLVLDGKKQSGDTPRVTLKSGSVGEGTHTLKFESADGKSSKETTLVVKFDNAAPAASIREPADGSFGPTDAVKVSGLVSEGWSVSIGGAAVPLDEQQRFSTTATPVPGENAIVLRLSHPARGVVYYVRHAGAVHP